MADAAGGSEAVRGVLPSILGKAKVVITPYPFGLSGDDNLRVTSVNALTGVTVQVHYRLLTRDGEVKAGVFSHTPNTNRTAKTDDFPLAGGFITNLSVFATAGTPLIGQTFVIVQLIRGMGSVAIVLGTMLQGYVTTTQGLGWPGSAIESSTDGEPALRTIVGTTPGAGASQLETVPTGARWDLLSICSTATEVGDFSLTVRTLTVTDGSGNTIGKFIPTTKFVHLGGNGVITFGQGLSPSTVPSFNFVTASLPSPFRLLAGATFGMDAMGGNGNWAAPVYVVREWQEAA